MKPFNVILPRLLFGAVVFTLAVILAAPGAFAQEARSLTIRGGNVYIDGELVPPGELPESLDLDAVDLRFRFSGEDEPMVTINGEMYVLEEHGLRPASGEEVFGVKVDSDANGEAPVIVRFRGEDGPPRVRDFTWDGDHQIDIPVQAYAAYLDSVDVEAMMDVEDIVARVEAVQDHVQEINLEKLAQRRNIKEQIEHGRLQALEAARTARQRSRHELHAYFGRLQNHHGDLFGQLQNEWRLEAESRQLARQAREEEDEGAREELERELREVLEDAFNLKLENRRREVEALEGQLDELREELAASREDREDIIDARMESLLQWW